ncbi:solute carrier family 2, facilitated glucose transporter member 6-like isoform X2 [Plodia interpunctella]|uniref:solute carrier family 2, facilitated glucose transporter member 6-like isoform X2 n=1 Tax=Plodia interpunctella TaxID=58824 RepID=UPI002367763A|nr:solute carrier family 2, facilitated glucose transporter member 6-like isoform X2 [Plodia interpunctella]
MKKYYFMFSEGSRINQILCAVSINFLLFCYGASIGWMSPMTLLLQSDNSPKGTPLSITEISWMASIAYLVAMVFEFIIAYMGEAVGRKITLIFLSASSVVCWILKLSSMEVWAFILARAMVGVTMSGVYVICPLYTKEISEDRIRGFLGTLLIFFQTSGNLFLYIIGDLLSYNTVLWICFAMPAVHILVILLMPESPSYLLKKGKNDEALKVMAWLRCRPMKDAALKQELDMIIKEQKADSESSQFALKAILQDKVLFRAFRIAVLVSLAREVCGACPVLNFAGEIFSLSSEGGGLAVLSSNQQAMVLGAVQVCGAMLASSVVELTGRKPLFIVTAVVSGLSMCLLASWFLARELGVTLPAWIPVTTLCLTIFCDASGIQPVSVVIMSEMFSYKYRGTVMAASMTLASVAAFLQMRFFKPLANAMGIHVSFYFFGAVCLTAALYVILGTPGDET